MNIYPAVEDFLAWAGMYKRVPILGAKKIPPFDLAFLFQRLFYGNNEAFLFESRKGPQETSRYSLMGIPNKNYVRIGDKHSTFRLNGNSKEMTGSVDDGWDALNFEKTIPSYKNLPHFWGGWVGYIAYEAVSSFENLPKRKHNDLGLSDAHFMQIDRVIVYDHQSHQLKYIIAAELTSDSKDYYQYISEINDVWKKIDSILSNGLIKLDLQGKEKKSYSNEIQSNLSRDEYKERVNRTKMYIREGDIYQANIAQRFDTKFTGDPLELYRKLRVINPSPFSGFLKFSNFYILSSSPERLLKVQGDKLETRPIAGTRPRSNNAEIDAALTKELLLSEKERAEHLMLVDLERNDMGRVCKTGSVKVTELMTLEQYSHVSHIVSNIEGKLEPNISIRDLLQSLFPGGTITGCPKIRCMEIIHELEPSSRGPYSGSFGYIGFSHLLDLNILIRTIIIKDGKAFFHVGAGIVADSDPDGEYEETLSKAAAMVQVLSDPTREC